MGRVNQRRELCESGLKDEERGVGGKDRRKKEEGKKEGLRAASALGVRCEV